MPPFVPAVPDAKLLFRQRRTNGSTQTFRRSSHAPSLSGSTAHSASRESTAVTTGTSGVYVPPHAQPGRNGAADGRYSRDQLLQLYRTQRDYDELEDGLSSLSMSVWEPHATNGASSASWGRKDDHGREAQSGVEQCWDRNGNTEPLSLRELNDEEREVRSLHACPHTSDTC
jgi:PERQ amino acid-rich with GYF domain-containing protein